MRESLTYAAGIAASPVPIASILLILSCRHPKANGLSFAVGWMVGLSAVAVTLTLIVQASDLTDSSPVWIAVLELLVGAAFLTGAAFVWRRRGNRGRRWVQAVEGFTGLGSAGLGVVLSGANPKVYALSLGAAVTLAKSDPDASLTASTVAVFVAVGAAGVVLPFGAYVAFPSRAEPLLSALRVWLGRHEAPVLFVLGVAIGAIFVTSGVGALRS